MRIVVSKDTATLGEAAALDGAAAIVAAIQARGRATIVLATGASQIATLDALVGRTDIDWSCVDVFHLDEYLGLPVTHRASFRRYLQERFVERVAQLKSFTAIDGTAPDTAAELARLNAALAGREVDVCFAGIGENGHLAFNDPPADFEGQDPFHVVELDRACRQQQFNEGWFDAFDAVPDKAISMSIAQIMRCAQLTLSVPDERKARAVGHALLSAVDPACPASILQRHRHCTLFLDGPSASALPASVIAENGR
ncbi:MAG: glucosamine-6-phosphate deaminase [Janthinobacterium lividum]